MKNLLRVLFVIFVVTTAISLAATVSLTISRATRHDWLITTAEITFIGLPDGVVYGTFTDCDDKVHPRHLMYFDGKFARFYALTPWAKDPEPYIGTTVRIMYDPSTLAQEERSSSTVSDNGEIEIWYSGIEIESYDIWLKKFIVSVSVFGVSAVLLAGVLIISGVRKRAEKKPEGDSVI